MTDWTYFNYYSQELSTMTNDSFMVFFWLTERRSNDSRLTITGRRMACRR